ncbi:hypothetical protein GCM10011584_19800 [Nocardioides phosphati]|uniref:Uncharacterized protein n=1 Tax=Nocardioides phosphati TaxID=1867775 RepID=A0ABQ2NBG1_9ACTN|nr:hypothetical protein [Nocardioides phosphati]GGO89705.1 hypothetical protein GCM10011584_19800 [Nocardioides phosphati]
MSKKTPDPQRPEQPESQPEASGSRWEPDPNAPTEQIASPAPAAAGRPAATESSAAPTAAPTAPTGAHPTAYPTPVNEAPSASAFAALKALSSGAKGALVGAAAVLVLGSGVTGFAIGQAGDDHQRVDVRFGQDGFDRDGSRGGFPGGGVPGQLPQGGAGQLPGQLPQGQMQGQLPQGGTQQDGSGTTQNDSDAS